MKEVGFPWEIDAFDAKEALRAGHEQPLATYLHEAAAILNQLSDLADQIDTGAAPRLKLVPADEQLDSETTLTNPERDEDWEGDPVQVRTAIERGNAQAVGWYLHDLGQVLHLLSAALVPTADHRGWRLEFIRKHRGRRSDPAKRWSNSRIEMELRFGALSGVKQESTIADLENKYGVSRATIMRIAQRKIGNRKSHKKSNC